MKLVEKWNRKCYKNSIRNKKKENDIGKLEKWKNEIMEKYLVL